MKPRLSFALAYRHVRAGIGRMALSVVAIALGVAVIVAFRLMNVAVLESFMETVDALTGRAAFRVVAGERVTFSEEVVERVAAVPGVSLAVPLVRSVAFPDDGTGELLTVHGVDLTHDAAVRLYHVADDPDEIIDDLVYFLSQPDSVVIGREFAESRGLRRGSTIDLITPRGVATFTVRGLLDPQGVARTLGGRLVVMDLLAAQRAFTADGQITQIDVVVAEPSAVNAAKAAVAAALPPGLWVDEPAVRKDLIRRSVSGFQAILTAFSIIAMLAGFVICYGRLRVVLEARTWEVGLLRAVGLRRGVVFAELLKEGLVLGAAGAALGVPLGVAIGHLALPVLAQAVAINFRLPVASAHAAVGPGTIVVGAGAGLLAAVAAAVLPSLRLVRTEPVAALTGRGRESRALGTGVGSKRAAGILVLVVTLLIAVQWLFTAPAIGLLTTGLMAVTTCALAGPLVRVGSRVLRRTLSGIFGPLGAMAAGHLAREPRRTALTVATLGVGLGAVLLFGMLGWSFERTLVGVLGRRMMADLVVSSPFMSAGYVSAPIAEGLLGELATVPGVTLTAGHQLKDLPYAGEEIAVAALDPPALVDARIGNWPLYRGAAADALARVARGEAVLVTGSYAYRFRTRPGDTVRLDSPNGPRVFEVAGVTGGLLENAIIMSREVYRAAWNDSLVSWAYVVLEPGADRRQVSAAITERLGSKYRIRVQSSPELVGYFAGQVREAFSALYLMDAIIFLLVLVGIGDTLAAGVVERTREFGLMRAVGLHRSSLFQLVMLEGVAIGALGLILAVAAGLALGIFWVEVQFPAILGWKLELHFPTVFALVAAALATALCLVGSLIPSGRAARLSVPAALRYE
jgi:putative ABC transport system permease protein